MAKLYNGKTLSERAKHCGKPRGTLKSRLRLGRSIEEALGLVPRKNFFQGMSATQLARKAGISRQSLFNRVVVLGRSKEEAIGEMDRINGNKNQKMRLDVWQLLELGQKHGNIATKFGVTRSRIQKMASIIGLRRNKKHSKLRI